MKLKSLLSIISFICIVYDMYSQSVVTSGLVLHLDAGNASSYPGTGNTWTDLSGNGRNGTLTNGPTYNSANGGSIVFDGSNDVISSFGDILDIGTNSWTVSCWVKFNSTSGLQGIIGKTSYRANFGRYSFYLEDDMLNAFVQFSGGNRVVSTSVTPYSTTGQFHNLVMTIDRTSIMKFYIDGISKGEINISAFSGDNLNSTDNFYIGSYGNNTGSAPEYFFNGNISHASIYNRALTEAEITQNYNAISSRTLPLTWQSFTATKQTAGVQLKWSTASEQNTKDFEIKYSTNTQDWSSLTTVAAAGNSSTLRKYSFFHNSPIKGNIYNYYRILQTDLDGKFSYSKIVSIICNESGSDVMIYPNPVRDIITIFLAEPQQVRLLNMAGTIVWKGRLAAGRNQLSVVHFPKGVYMLQTNIGAQRIIID